MSDEVQTFDAILIGAGQANPAVADRLKAEGWTCALVERTGWGGTCVRRGMILFFILFYVWFAVFRCPLCRAHFWLPLFKH